MKWKCPYVNFGNFVYNWTLRATGFCTGNSFEFFSTFRRIIFSLFFWIFIFIEGVVGDNRKQSISITGVWGRTKQFTIGLARTTLLYEIRRLSSGAVSETINLSGLRPPVDINNPYEFHAVMYAVCRNVIPRSHGSRPNIPCCTQQLNSF